MPLSPPIQGTPAHPPLRAISNHPRRPRPPRRARDRGVPAPSPRDAAHPSSPLPSLAGQPPPPPIPTRHAPLDQSTSYLPSTGTHGSFSGSQSQHWLPRRQRPPLGETLKGDPFPSPLPWSPSHPRALRQRNDFARWCCRSRRGRVGERSSETSVRHAVKKFFGGFERVAETEVPGR